MINSVESSDSLHCNLIPAMTESSDEYVGNMCPPETAERNPGTTTNHRILTKSNVTKTETANSQQEDTEEFVPRIRWPDTIVQIFLHAGCLYGFILCLVSAKFYTTLFGKSFIIRVVLPESALDDSVEKEYFERTKICKLFIGHRGNIYTSGYKGSCHHLDEFI